MNILFPLAFLILSYVGILICLGRFILRLSRGFVPTTSSDRKLYRSYFLFLFILIIFDLSWSGYSINSALRRPNVNVYLEFFLPALFRLIFYYLGTLIIQKNLKEKIKRDRINKRKIDFFKRKTDFFRTYWDQIPEPILVIKKPNKISYWNNYFLESGNWTNERLRNETVRKIIPNIPLRRLWNTEADETVQITLPMMQGDDTTKMVKWFFRTAVDENDVSILCIGTPEEAGDVEEGLKEKGKELSETLHLVRNLLKRNPASARAIYASEYLKRFFRAKRVMIFFRYGQEPLQCANKREINSLDGSTREFLLEKAAFGLGMDSLQLIQEPAVNKNGETEEDRADESMPRLALQPWHKSDDIRMCILIQPGPEKLTKEQLNFLGKLTPIIGMAYVESWALERFFSTQKKLNDSRHEIKSYLKEINGLSDKLSESRVLIKAKNKELEDFISGISHDLKNPLVSLDGLIHMFFDHVEMENDADAAFLSDRIRYNLGHINNVVRDLAEYYRISTVREKRQVIDLNEMVDRLLREFKDKYPGISFEKRGKFNFINGEKNRIYKVLFHLIENSCIHMGETEKPRILIGAGLSENSYQLWVEDNGQGIPDEYHEKVFQAFQRLDPSRGKTGMGLNFVQKILDLHHADIQLHTPKKGGSRFVVSFQRTYG